MEYNNSGWWNTALISIGLLISACSNPNPNAVDDSSKIKIEPSATVAEELFGTTKEGQDVRVFTMINSKGATMKATNYGGVILSLTMPDKNGKYEDVVLGFDSLAPYENISHYFGALIGRYGNRIAKGRFHLDGQTYQVPVNNGENSLHGGTKGFDKVVWEAETFQNEEGVGMVLKHLSADGEQGYPGNLQAEVRYTLTNDNALRINYRATTDKSTVVNLTQHSYFNLSGNTRENILSHKLTLAADSIVPVDKNLIPTGKLMPVKGTAFDFTEPTPIGKRINNDEVQLENGGGYDHCWVLKNSAESMHFAGKLTHNISGRTMEIFTDEPGIQFYSGNFLDGSLTGKYGTKYDKHMGLALETQHFPDSPNQPSFPNTTLNPGEVYETSTIYKFSVVE